MKVIKRDGRIVDYDKSKIEIAIEKANQEVSQKEKATKSDIKIIVSYIEDLHKKRILVEDIQDIIEQKLMEIGKYELAKKYIVYRYNRALIRKSNTTDKTILGLIRNNENDLVSKNSNKNMAAMQRDLIAGEVSKDLTQRVLLPEKITNACKEGILYFHASEYFIQPVINNSIINLEDMLENGTVLNEKMIETPKSFGVACTVTTQIILSVACNQYGEQLIDLRCLGKYLRKSKMKFEKEIREELGDNIDEDIFNKMVNKRMKTELSAGVQTLQYQMNTLITANGKEPEIALLLYLKENDEYLQENAEIVEELIKQRIEGIKNEDGEFMSPVSPKLVYVITKLNNLNGGKYDYLTELALECSSKIKYPEYIHEEFLEEYKQEKGNFSQGTVSINLPQIGIVAEGNEDKFWSLLDERLELCRDALMCRHYALLGTYSDISPIHWKYGAIARLQSGEKIDKFLFNGDSSVSLGYVGMCELVKFMKEINGEEFKENEFIAKIIKRLKEVASKWKKDTNIYFFIEEINNEEACYKLVQIDQERFGTIDGVTDHKCYTNYTINLFEKDELIENIMTKEKIEKNKKLRGERCLLQLKVQ